MEIYLKFIHKNKETEYILKTKKSKTIFNSSLVFQTKSYLSKIYIFIYTIFKP